MPVVKIFWASSVTTSCRHENATETLGVPLEVANQIGIGPVEDLDADPQPLSDITFLDFDQTVVFEPQGS